MADLEPVSGGELLKRYRTGAGLTQEELAERAGLSARAIRALEAGARRSPRKDTIQLLASALGLSESERGRFEASLRRGVATRTAPAPPRATAIRRHRAPLIGRQSERALLVRAFGEEAPPLTLIAGEPGIGKSRLLEETAAFAEDHGWTLLVGGCHRRSAQQPFSPFVEALTHFLATRDEAQQRRDAQGCAWLVGLLPELARKTLVPSPGWTLTPAQERRLMFAAVARFLGNVAGPAGVLLLLDDLQWAGVDALDLLAALLREPSAPGVAPIRVIGAYRDTDVTSGDPLPMLLADLAREELAASIALEPLNGDDATTLLAALLADVTGADDATRSRLLALAGGVPFFLVSGAQETRVRAQAPQPGARLSVPWSAAESIRQRATLLSPPAAELLAIGAVAERALPRPAVLRCAALLGHDEQTCVRALQEVTHARLVTETSDGGYRVTHDLIWETIQADMTGARRASLHRHIAAALESLAQPERRAEELAWHYSQGDELARALPFALEAGDQAGSAYANHEAAAHYTTAAAWARTLGDHASEGAALEKFSQVAYRLARYDAAIEALTRAMAIYRNARNWERLTWATTERIRMAEPLRRFEAGLAQVYTLFAELTAAADGRDHAHTDEPLESGALTAGELLTRVAHIATLVSPGAVARLLLCLTTRLLFSGRYAEALAPSEQTIHYARIADNLRVECTAYSFRSEAQLAQGLVEQARDSAEMGRLRGMASGELEAVYLALEAHVNIHETQAEPAQAIATLREMREVSRRLGDTTYLGDTFTALAAFSFLVGAWDDARAYLVEAGDAKRHNEFHHRRTPVSILALLDLAQGDVISRAAIARAAEGEGRVWVWTIAALAERDILAGEASSAAARLRQVIGAMEREPSSVCYLLAPLAWAESRMGQREQAAQTLARAREIAARLNNRMALVDIERAEAHLAVGEGRWDDARRALDASLALCLAMPYPYAEVKARLLAGDLLAATHAPQQAREQYEVALAICARLGERLYRDHIEQALQRLRVD